LNKLSKDGGAPLITELALRANMKGNDPGSKATETEAGNTLASSGLS
jgi:hypothetical protein